ncbi:MAG: hypothetical protein AAF576_11760, partial [Pseudomonadota bacterium]
MTSPRSPKVSEAQQISCILLPRFNMMGMVSLLEPTRIANYLSDAPLYTHSFHAAEAGKVTSSNGMEVTCMGLPGKLTRDDIV